MIEKMQAKIEAMRPKWEAINWESDQVYGKWLTQAYFIARRSTAFLGLCLFHSDKNRGFQARCTEHIAEETGHEKLIENDFKQLGLSIGEEMPATMAIYQPQYFQIVSKSPLAFVGYIFMLELLAPVYGPYIMNRVSNKKALSFLKVHTSADEDHIESAKKILAGMSEEEQMMAWANFEMTLESYISMLEQIAKTQQQSLKVA